MAPTPHHPRGYPIAELGLPPKLLERVTVDGTIVDTFDLGVLHPDALRMHWKISAADFRRINAALEERGLRPLDMPADVVARVAKPKPVCEEKGPVEGTICGMARMKGRRKCGWHYLLGIPIEKQILLADERAAKYRAVPGHIERARVPQAEWPEGGRWCSECQGFIPWIYVTGSKCKAHASRAAHNTRLKAVYDIDRPTYEKLLAFQGGRCYICRQEAHSTRLAVDHDHVTGAVRGLLCANDEWGCNVSLRRLLNNLAMAQRALEYVSMSPFDRMRLEMDDEQPEAPEQAPVMLQAAEAWNPFAAVGA